MKSINILLFLKFHQGEEDKKDFTFDFSYWSFNSRDRHFATQERVILLKSYICYISDFALEPEHLHCTAVIHGM